MSVRKRTWKNGKGEQKEAWIVDYTDQSGERHIKTFQRKKEADAYEATATVEVREGVHVADSVSITVEKAGKLWIATAENAGLERTTLDQYRQHLTYHINPFLGRTLLSRLTTPAVRTFEDRRYGERSVRLIKQFHDLGALTEETSGMTTTDSCRDMIGNEQALSEAGLAPKKVEAFGVGQRRGYKSALHVAEIALKAGATSK